MPPRRARMRLELAQLPADIAALEKEQEALLASLSDGSLYKDQTAKRTEIEIRLVEIEKLMTKNFARWEALEAKNT